MNLPTPKTPFVKAFRARRADDTPETLVKPKLLDYPDLIQAATTTTAKLDVDSGTFAAVQGCLETLCRLNLSPRAAWAMQVLAKHGPLSLGILQVNVKVVTSACMTSLALHLEALGMIGLERRGPDGRFITASLSAAGTRVLASIVALTGIAEAASVLNRQPRESVVGKQ